MRALVLMSGLLAPTLAAANPCEELARAICPSKDAVGECFLFVDGELVKPAGSALAPVERQNVCKGTLDDKAKRDDLKARMQARWESRWFLVDVAVEPKKADGSSWDAEGGLPDLALCYEVAGGESGCRPEGRDAASVSRAVCPDETRCLFTVYARRGATVGVDVLDVDDEKAEYVGVCAFTAGRAGAQCDGPVALATEAGGPGVGSLERRFLGRWVMDVEGTLAREPKFRALSLEQRVEAMEAMGKEVGESYFHFTVDGWLVIQMRGDMKQGRYSIAAVEGDTFTLKVTAAGREDETVKVEVTDRGLRMVSGKDALALLRAP